ncbi:MAG: SCO1664 family protein [Thermomicrobiales bacterium]
MPDLVLRLDEDDDAPTRPPLSEEQALALLERAEITAARLIPWGSNYTFGVAMVDADESEHLAIYKPRAGEAPLYDFPDGTLYRREMAAFVVSQHLGWNIVPPTVVRDGPNGVGSLQLYVEPHTDGDDPSRYWSQCSLDIERIVLFDHLTNNSDRKLGHCLRDVHGKLWGIDHGLTFNTFPKLRTVLWQFVGDPISAALLADLNRLIARPDDLRARLRPLLANDEINAFFTRTERMLSVEVYPHLSSRRNVPWGWW